MEKVVVGKIELIASGSDTIFIDENSPTKS